MFDENKLRMLSQEADDWNTLLTSPWRNIKNMLEGVLLYPKSGMSEKNIRKNILEYIGTLACFDHSESKIIRVTTRGKDWAIAYSIYSFYNHFDLLEEYD